MICNYCNNKQMKFLHTQIYFYSEINLFSCSFCEEKYNLIFVESNSHSNRIIVDNYLIVYHKTGSFSDFSEKTFLFESSCLLNRNHHPDDSGLVGPLENMVFTPKTVRQVIKKCLKYIPIS